MAYRGGRGGGRGRGRGPGSFSFAKKEPYHLFPDIELPKIGASTQREEALIVRDMKLRNYWINSPYYIQQEDEDRKPTRVLGGGRGGDIERYSDTHNVSVNHKEKQLPFSYYMKLYSGKFPEELLNGKKRVGPQQKKVKVWDTEAREKKAYDFFEKLEKIKGEKGEDDDEKKKKEGEEKDEDGEEGGEEEDGELSDDGDYNENEYFDDDEDDFNMDEGVDEVEDNMF